MRTLGVLSAAGLLSLTFAAVAGDARYMSVDEVKAGMEGVGKTVFAGSEIEDFKVRVLGVLRNAVGPRRSLILARLDGGPLASTGVIAGMSGSPVYLDGRLAGAVAYSLGSFTKEPIAGITPIMEMIDGAGGWSATAGRTATNLAPLLASRDDLIAYLTRVAPERQPFANRPEDVRWSAAPGNPAFDTRLGPELRPLDTPLFVAGFSDEGRDRIAELLQPRGFLPVMGGTSMRQDERRQPESELLRLRPGDAVGVDLIRGDFAMGATGTVTEVSGDQVYAFGHPFYNLGPTRFPMTRAYVHTILPSLFASTKVATTLETVGTFRQDRSTVFAGTLDAGPRLIPVSLSLAGGGGAAPRTFRFSVVQDQSLTPLLAYVAIANTLMSYARTNGAATFGVTGRALVSGHRPILYDDVFVGDSPATAASAYVAAPLAVLLGNEFEIADLDAIELTIASSERQLSTTIQRAWIDSVKPRPGTTVALKIVLRGYRGDEETRTVPIAIPQSATGTLTLLVADAQRLAQWEQREERPTAPIGLDRVIDEINRTRRNNRLYVRLIGGAPGAVVNGERLPALPPSVLAIYESDRNSGSFAPLRNAFLGEWDLATRAAVVGSRQLTFSVEPER